MSQIDGDHFRYELGGYGQRSAHGRLEPLHEYGVDFLAQWLCARISEVIDRFWLDAYFLDIVGGMGKQHRRRIRTRARAQLVTELRAKYPRACMALGEMHYDALLSFIPVFHVQSGSPAYPAGVDEVCAGVSASEPSCAGAGQQRACMRMGLRSSMPKLCRRRSSRFPDDNRGGRYVSRNIAM